MNVHKSDHIHHHPMFEAEMVKQKCMEIVVEKLKIHLNFRYPSAPYADP